MNLSGKDEDIQNLINIISTVIPPALGETSQVNFGPVTLEISMWNRTHLKCLFPKTIFRPVGGGVSPIFLHALENDQVFLAHPHRGRGSPLQFVSKGGPKLA